MKTLGPRLRRALRWAPGLAFSATLAFAAALVAAPRREVPASTLRLSAEAGGAELELGFDGARFAAPFVLENAGTTPAKVVRLAPRPSTDGRTVTGVTIETEGGPVGTLAPGAKRRGVLRWTPSAARELYGTLEAEPERGPVASVSVHAERGALERGLTSLLVFLPLFVGALGAALFGAEAVAQRTRRVVLEALAFACVCVAAVAASRVDGGAWAVDAAPLSYVERVRLGSLEWFVGLSGTTAGALVVITAAFAGAVALTRSEEGASPLAFLGLGLGTTGLLGALVAQTGLLLAGFLALGLAGVALALRGRGAPEQRRASRAFALVGAAASLLVLFAVVSVAKTAPVVPGWAGGADGSWSLPDASAAVWGLRLAAGGFTALGPIAAAGFIKLVALAVLLGLGALLPAPGLGEWLAPVVRLAPRPALALLVGALPPAAGALLVRLGPDLLPAGARWMAPSLVWLGALGLVLSSVRVLRARDLRGLLAAAIGAQGSLALVGLGALLPQGVAAALAGPVAAGAGALLFVLATAHVEDALGTGDLAVLAGHAREAPTVAGALVVALGGLACLPTSLGASTLLLAVFGSMPRYPTLALVVGLAWALFATAVLARLFVALRGRVDPELAGVARLEPFGGRLPELRGPSAALSLALALALVVLGLWPYPVLSLLDLRVLEIHRKLDPPGLIQVS